MSQRQTDPRDPQRVLHDEIEAQPAGFKGAAKRIGRSTGVLYNLFSEEMPHYKVGLREAIALAAGLPTKGFIEAMCEQFDGLFISLPPAGEAADCDIFTAHLAVMTQIGELCRELTEARNDGLIDPDEFAALKVRGMRAIRTIHVLLQELSSQVVQPGAVRSIAK